MTRRVLIVGAGKAGTAIAEKVLRRGHDVQMIERRREHVDETLARLEGIPVTLGVGTDPMDLEAAGIRACDTVVAATGSDEVNLVASTLAKFEFGIELVLARVVDPRNAWLFGGDMGVDVALEETHVIADLAVERISGDARYDSE